MHRALRCRAVHWRFQVLVDAYPKLGASTVEDVWDWSLRVERAVLDVLGSKSDAYDIVREVRHLMRVVDSSPRRVRRKDHLTMEVFGPIRGRTYAALMAAAAEDQEDRMVVRVVDLHPWIAEAAEPLFDDGHYSQAILAAAQNLEVRWRKLLGVSDGSLSDLATRSFSADDPNPGRPKLRFPEAGSDTKSDGWKNAHLGAMKYAEGCAMRIRNLNLHHPENGEPEPGLTIETLSALSVLARWVTTAEVQTGRPPWMDLPRGGGAQ